jgi:hypothetical protein
MTQAIVISTTPTTTPWLMACMQSLEGYDKYPVVILSDYTWELGKIKWIYDHTDIDEFFFLPDSSVIKNKDIFDKMFGEFQGCSITFHHFGDCYMVKYRREILDKMNFPIIHNKSESIYFERWWNNAYFELDHPEVFYGELGDAIDPDKMDEKFGRKNLKMETKDFCKWKGTWDVTQYEPIEDLDFKYYK